MSKKKGKDCKITLGSYTILGMGKWDMSGVTTDLLESTEFGESWKQFMMGLKDGGEVTFDGLFDLPDTTGQAALRTANLNETELTDIRFYVDNTTYYIPATTNPVSHVLITSWKVGADKSGLVTASFTGKIVGKMELL